MAGLIGKLSKYELLSELGWGSFATVYRARDTRLNREVALKVLNPALASDSHFPALFLREAQTVASLEHPNIVTIWESDQTDDGWLYIAMRLLPGMDLRRRIERDGPLPLPLVVSIVEQIASALAYAHERGIVHRDVKSANIIVDESGEATLTDFGLVRAVESSSYGSSLSLTGGMVGTVEYISPEQVQGQKATPKSDLYALGIVAYEMLTGQVPYKAETPIAIAFAHVNTPPPDLKSLRPELPETAIEVLEKSVAKMPEDRQAGMLTFSTDLRDALDRSTREAEVRAKAEVERMAAEEAERLRQAERNHQRHEVEAHAQAEVEAEGTRLTNEAQAGVKRAPADRAVAEAKTQEETILRSPIANLNLAQRPPLLARGKRQKSLPVLGAMSGVVVLALAGLGLLILAILLLAAFNNASQSAVMTQVTRNQQLQETRTAIVPTKTQRPTSTMTPQKLILQPDTPTVLSPTDTRTPIPSAIPSATPTVDVTIVWLTASVATPKPTPSLEAAFTNDLRNFRITDESPTYLHVAVYYIYIGDHGPSAGFLAEALPRNYGNEIKGDGVWSTYDGQKYGDGSIRGTAHLA